MPVNAPAEYYKAEMKYAQAKIREEKMAALEEMISLLPRHHGSENAHAQLKSRLAQMKKEGEKKGPPGVGIKRVGDAQFALLANTNSENRSFWRPSRTRSPKSRLTNTPLSSR